MARKVLACLLALTVATPAASLNITDNLQELLVNPWALGAKVKRSTSDNWDKEFVLDDLGIALQLKFFDPSNPLKGGLAHVRFPGRKFINGAPFEDMDLNIEFHGGNNSMDGLFDMKIKYKFMEKFILRADQLQEGEVLLQRKLEGGLWKSRMAITNTNQRPAPFFDVTIDSDRLNKLDITFKYGFFNKLVLKMNYFHGHSIAGSAVINGEETKFIGTLDQAAKKLNVKVECVPHIITHNVDFQLTTTGEWGVTVIGDVFGPIDFKLAVDQNFKEIDFVAKYKNKKYAYVKLTGDGVTPTGKSSMVPSKVDYIMIYNIMDDMEGKANINLDLISLARTMRISFVSKENKDLDMVFKLEGPLDKAFTFKMVTTREGVNDTKFVNDVKFENTADRLMVDTKYDISMDHLSMFHTFFCREVGMCLNTGHREINLVYMKKDKNFLFGKTKFTDKTIVDGVMLQDKKLDTMSTPYTMMWYQTWNPHWMTTPYNLFGQRIHEVKAWHTVGKELKIVSTLEDIRIHIKPNPSTPGFFAEFSQEGESMLKVQTDVTPWMVYVDIKTTSYHPSNSLLHRVSCMYCTYCMYCFNKRTYCFNKRKGHIQISFEKITNKFKVEFKVAKDTGNGHVMSFVMNAMDDPYTFNLNAPSVLPRVFGNSTRKTIEASLTFWKGNKLVQITSNCPEFETFLISSAGSKKTVTINGREVMMFNHTTGEKRVSQAVELASGEQLTTTLEWIEDILHPTSFTVLENKATLTMEVNPNSKFIGSINWDFKNPMNGKLEFDTVGDIPMIGEYKISRMLDWSFTDPNYMVNWSGKTRSARGPLSVVSPMDTLIHLTFNRNHVNLDGDMVEIIGGKKWGVTVSSNQVRLLAGEK